MSTDNKPAKEYTPIDICPKCGQPWDEEKWTSNNGVDRYTYACNGCNVQAKVEMTGYQ